MKIFKRAIFILILIIVQGCGQSSDFQNNRATNDVKWHAFNSSVQSGLLGERQSIWRKERLWGAVNIDFLLAGFEFTPGIHLWQGEYIGKWLHTATLYYEEIRNVELTTALDNVADRPVKTRAENGYIIETDEESERFYNFSDGSFARASTNIEGRIQGQFEMHNNAEDILFTITDSNIVLVPYYMNGIDGRGESPRTYFKI